MRSIDTLVVGGGQAALASSHLRLPVLDGSGWPIHEDGVSSEPALGFAGLRFQVSRKSDLLFGVVADAGRVVDRLVAAGREVVR